MEWGRTSLGKTQSAGSSVLIFKLVVRCEISKKFLVALKNTGAFGKFLVKATGDRGAWVA